MTIPNAPPIFGIDDFVVLKNSPPVFGNVLANDADPDGDPLVVVNPGTQTRTSSDGTTTADLVLNSDGSYVFTVYVNNPAIARMQSGQSQTYSFFVTISDGHFEVPAGFHVEIRGFDDPLEEGEDEDDPECDNISVPFPCDVSVPGL